LFEIFSRAFYAASKAGLAAAYFYVASASFCMITSLSILSSASFFSAAAVSHSAISVFSRTSFMISET